MTRPQGILHTTQSYILKGMVLGLGLACLDKRFSLYALSPLASLSIVLFAQRLESYKRQLTGRLKELDPSSVEYGKVKTQLANWRVQYATEIRWLGAALFATSATVSIWAFTNKQKFS